MHINKLIVLLSFLITILVIINAQHQYSNNSDKPPIKYIFSKQYQASDKECLDDNSITYLDYDTSGYCNLGTIMTCSKDNSQILFQFYENFNCTGTLYENFLIETNNCSSTGSQAKMYCVDSIKLPTSNSYIEIQTIDNTCDWKRPDNLKHITVTTLNLCIEIPDAGQSVYSSCNQTSLTQNYYNGYNATSCNTQINYKSSFILPECSDDSSFTYICN